MHPCKNRRVGHVQADRKKIHPPGSAIVISPDIYHTIEPLPGYSAVTINVYAPPLERYKGRPTSGSSCLTCDETTYTGCELTRNLMNKRPNPNNSPAGNDISKFLKRPPAANHGITDFRIVSSHLSLS